MTSILKVDEIQNTDGKTGIVITPDGSLESVKFPEQSNPSGRVITSTTMSSYETGTWNAAIGTATNLGKCYYTKVGKLVTVFFDITASTHVGNTNAIGGLPFIVGITHGTGTIVYSTAESIDGTVLTGGYVGSGEYNIRLTKLGDTDPTYIPPLSRIIGSAVYHTNE